MTARTRVAVAVGTALLVAGATAAAGSARAANRSLTIYATAVRVQFSDHSDDRTRGATQNPFNANVDALLPQTKEMQKGGGPYPGDTAAYSFKLYGDRALKRKVGTADYSCSFVFHKRAICTATFEVGANTIFAQGQADFTGSNFSLAVVGGTNRYIGVVGQVSAVPALKNSHKLSFSLAP